MHRMSITDVSLEVQQDAAEDVLKVSEIDSIIPGHSQDFLRACLVYYDGSVEHTIAALCEPDSLPASLKLLMK